MDLCVITYSIKCLNKSVVTLKTGPKPPSPSLFSSLKLFVAEAITSNSISGSSIGSSFFKLPIHKLSTV